VASSASSNQSSGSYAEAGSSEDFLKLLTQSYLLCFKDEHASFPNTIFKLFKGEFKRDLDSADFIASSENSILHMKYVIMQSIRMAFHYA
jgi:hypothetical protein